MSALTPRTQKTARPHAAGGTMSQPPTQARSALEGADEAASLDTSLVRIPDAKLSASPDASLRRTLDEWLEASLDAPPLEGSAQPYGKLEPLRAQLALLAEREQSWRVLFEASPDAIFRTSPDGTIHAANAAACALVGRDEAEIRRLGRNGIIDCSDPGWSSFVAERERRGQAISEGTLIRGDGARLPVEVSAVLYTDARGRLRSDMFVRDVSRRKRMLEALRESEARYRDLVENANDMIYVCDPYGCWLHINSGAVLRILGYREDDLIGHHFLDIIRPDWRPAAAHFYREQFEQRLATTYFEFPVLAKNGREHWVGQNVRLIAQGDRIVRFEAIARDLTERKAAEEALQRSTERAKQLLAHLSTVREEESAKIAREVHDELGGSLTALRLGLAGAIAQLAPDDPMRERLTALIGVTQTASEAIRRISASLRPQLLDTLGLSAAIRQHASDFSRLTGIACALTLPAHIALSAERAIGMFRIVQESLTNVARHAGAQRVQLSLRRRGNAVCMRLHDDGIGFAADAPPREGSYGLLGMRERSQQLGGRFTLLSRPGCGTTVRLSLPLER